MLKRDSDFITHLEEFRRRLIICAGAFLFVAVCSYFFSDTLLDFLITPLRQYQDVDLYFQKPYEAFLIRLKASAITGLVFSFPLFLAQLWLFVAPGLYTNEKRIVFPLILVSAILFLAGAYFAYQVVIPFSLNFLLSFQTDTLKPLLGVGDYFSYLLGMILAFGILFDFPIILIGLIRLGTVKTKTLEKARKIIIVLIFIVAAILTPPDPVSQALLALPLIILFEISVLIGKWLERKRSSQTL